LATKFSGKEKQLANSLNSLGYRLFYAYQNAAAAVKVLTISTDFDPKAGYIWDSIGEIYFSVKGYSSS